MSPEPILSIHPRYASALFARTKTVEFRRKPIAVPHSGRVWVYATKPIAALLGYIEVTQIVEDSPDELWRMYSELGEIEEGAFSAYFSGCQLGYALMVSDATALPDVISLEEMREACPSFVPPQFYMRNVPDALASLLQH
jgi:predicted transcriptional regulator